MQISSPKFKFNDMMPENYTCDGDDVNPELIIEDIPVDAKSLLLIVEDPDSPLGNWVHWVVFDIPLTNRIEENSIPGIQGVNSYNFHDYQGPCHSEGIDRYIFKIYTIDSLIGASRDITASELLQAAEGHILDEAYLVSRYGKPAPTHSD